MREIIERVTIEPIQYKDLKSYSIELSQSETQKAGLSLCLV